MHSLSDAIYSHPWNWYQYINNNEYYYHMTLDLYSRSDFSTRGTRRFSAHFAPWGNWYRRTVRNVYLCRLLVDFSRKFTTDNRLVTRCKWIRKPAGFPRLRCFQELLVVRHSPASFQKVVIKPTFVWSHVTSSMHTPSLIRNFWTIVGFYVRRVRPSYFLLSLTRSPVWRENSVFLHRLHT